MLFRSHGRRVAQRQQQDGRAQDQAAAGDGGLRQLQHGIEDGDRERDVVARPERIVAAAVDQLDEGHEVVDPRLPRAGRGFRPAVDRLDAEIDELVALGIPSVLLFGIPAAKDARGTSAYDPDGPVPRATRAIKARAPEMIVIADVCLCEYTSHGHCGVLVDESGDVRNDETLELLGRASVAYADAGADVIAPSAMMDFQVAEIGRAHV